LFSFMSFNLSYEQPYYFACTPPRFTRTNFPVSRCARPQKMQPGIKANQQFHTCDLKSRVYLYGDSEGHNLRYCFLPSAPDDVLRWTTVPSHAPIRGWDG